MIDPGHALPISGQAEELEISRSTVYYQPRPVPDADLFLMRRLDELHLNHPFARNAGGLTRDEAGRGNAGLMESAENDTAVSRPSHRP